MLEIYINEELIEIGIDFGGVNIEILNSLFYAKSTHSFNFFLPNTEAIIEALNYKTIDNVYDNVTINNILFVYSTLRLSGTFKIIEIADDIECYFVSGLNVLIDKYKNIQLRDLTYNVFSDIDAAAASSYPTYAYTALPIDITNDELLAYFDDLIPVFGGGTKWRARIFVNYPLTDNSILSGEIKAAVVGASGVDRINYIYSYLNPFFYVSFVVSKIFENLGVNVVTNVFETDSDLKKLTINYLNPKETIGTIYLRDYVPDISASDFLDSLELFGVKVLFNFQKNEVKIVKIIDQINAAPTDNLTSITEKIRTRAITQRFNYRLQYDLSQNDIYLDEANEFPDYDYIDNVNNSRKDLPFNICPVSTFEDIADPPATTSGLAFFIYNQDIGGGNFKVYYRQWEIPKINTKLTVGELDPTILIYDGEQKLRILFFDNTIEEAFRQSYNSSTGVNDLEAAQTYPAGLYYTATISLKWTGVFGVFFTILEDLLVWENQLKKPLKAKINLSTDKIMSFDDINTYTVDNYKCFISKMPIRLKYDKLIIGDVDLFTV